MAVPPIQRSPRPADVRHPWLLDTVLGLLVVAALPLAIITIPNTLSVVAKLLPGDIDQVGLMRMHGLALPALMLAVPLGAVALRRFKPAHLMLAGLALMALSDAAGGYAASELVVGAVRVLRGIGAGLVVPATLAAVWHRAPVLRALWVGVFSLSMLAAEAFALWPLDEVSSWKVTLQPYPLVTGVALALAAVYLIAWMLLGRPAEPHLHVRERSRLVLAAVPAAGIAVVAISTATEGWRALPVIMLAGTAVAGLLALASIGTRESRTLAYSMVAVGVVLVPSAAQVTLVEMGGLGGPGLRGLWIPYGVAGLLAVGASVVVRLSARASGRWLAPLGLLSMVVGLCSVRVVVPSADGLVLAVPFTLLAVGAAVALTATLQEVSIGTAAFGLSLCFAGVLAGFLLGTGVQMAMLDGVKSAQELVDNFVGALHWWALIGGFLVVAVIVLAALMARRPGDEATAGPDDGPSTAGPGAEDCRDAPTGDDGGDPRDGGDALPVPGPAGDGAGFSQDDAQGGPAGGGVESSGVGGGRKWGDVPSADGVGSDAAPRGSTGDVVDRVGSEAVGGLDCAVGGAAVGGGDRGDGGAAVGGGDRGDGVGAVGRGDRVDARIAGRGGKRASKGSEGRADRKAAGRGDRTSAGATDGSADLTAGAAADGGERGAQGGVEAGSAAEAGAEAGSAPGGGADAGARRLGGGEAAGGGDEDGPTGIVPRIVLPVSSQGAFDKVRPPSGGDEPADPEGTAPAVPPQGNSPEDAASP
ncbi:hypothetical protein EDD27_6260 [Nonomuraea polychroma]|uniref:MFS transporter n=1 Tax=Nonomuraea polychroma TaxID=46176 RepID=A0A438MCZ3_9ACTN|nr:hypothetical protein [Nonomuraea polychroma]RVX43574.1 hypothetical protein EDD27_6260 [Nonomuraea polychroma]